jgi:peptide/nickel transport system substrate-binding protein
MFVKLFKQKLFFIRCLFLIVLLSGFCMISNRPALAKDELVVALRGEPSEGFDPIMGWGRYGNPLFQSTLLKRDNDLKVVKDLAVNYSVDAAGMQWQVTIRKDVSFSDGKPLTAEDVAFTFNTAAKAGGKVDLTTLDKAVAADTHTVVFHMKKRDSTFIGRLITLGIVPQHAYDDQYGRSPIGSGPFKMVSWVEGEQMTAEVNPHYYGKVPGFKRIVFLYGEEDTMFAAAKAGKLDMVVVPQHLGLQKLAGMHVHAVKSVDNRGFSFPMVRANGRKTDKGAPIGNNVTADPAIRKAVTMAVDRRALVNGVLEGFGRPAYFVCDSMPWDNPKNVIKDADIKGARKLLAEAGWKDSDNDGVVDKNGRKAEFTIVYPASRTMRQGLALAGADMLKKIGIRAHVVGKSWDEIKQMMHSNVIVFGWGSHDPMEMYHLYHSKLAGQSWFNPTFYANKAVDAYLDKAVGAATLENALPYWQKAQWDGETGCGPRGDAPWVWLVNLDYVYFVSDCLDIGKSRIEPHGHGWPITANIEQWSWSCR